jgi:tetratricopeptide (TPR) repeat protein
LSVVREHELLRVRQLGPACSLGLVYGNAGRWEQAAAGLEEYLDIEPHHSGALHDLAHACVKLGKGELAKEVLWKAVADPRARTGALRALVSVSLELGDRDAARGCAREASHTDVKRAADPRVRELLAE